MRFTATYSRRFGMDDNLFDDKTHAFEAFLILKIEKSPMNGCTASVTAHQTFLPIGPATRCRCRFYALDR